MKTGKKRKVIVSVTSLLLIFTAFLSSLSTQVFAAEAKGSGDSPTDSNNITEQLKAKFHLYLNSIQDENELGQNDSPVIRLTDTLLFRFNFSVPDTLNLEKGNYYHMELPKYLQIQEGSWNLEATVERQKTKNDGSTTGSDPPSSSNKDDEEKDGWKEASNSLNNDDTDADKKGTQTPSSDTTDNRDSDSNKNEESDSNSTFTDDSSNKKESKTKDAPHVSSDDTTFNKEDDLDQSTSETKNEDKDELELQQIAPLALGSSRGSEENEVETIKETITIGEVRIKDQDFFLEFTYDDYSDLSNISGYFDADITFNPKEIEVDENGNFSVELGDTVIEIETDSKASASIKKSGSLNPDGKTVTWTVKINPNGANLNGYSFVDSLQTRRYDYVDKSFQLNGKEATPEFENNILIYTFKEDTKEPQTIQFQTSLQESVLNGLANNNKKQDSLENIASLKNGSTEIAKATAKVNLYGTSINKTGVQKGDKVVWTIKVNEAPNQMELTDAYIQDPLKGQTLVPDELTYTMGDGTKGKIPLETENDSSPVYYTYKNDVLEIHFRNGLTQACTISVTTTPDSGEAVKSLTNKATLYGKTKFDKWLGNKNGLSATATLGYIGNQGAITKTGVKYDSTTSQVTWNIKVKASLEDAIVKDGLETSPSNANGQKFVSVSLDGGATTIPEKSEVNGKTPYYTLTQNDTKENLEVHLGKTDGEEINLTLVTQLTNPNIYSGNGSGGGQDKQVTNTATLFDGEIQKSKDDASFTVRSFTMNKRGGSYNKETHTILWIMDINQNGMKMKDLKVTDTLPEGLELDTSYNGGLGYAIYTGTAVQGKQNGQNIGPAFQTNLTNLKKIDGTSMDLMPIQLKNETVNNKQKLTFFADSIDQPYAIYFQTKVTDEYLAKISSGQKGTGVRNTAYIKGSNTVQGSDYQDTTISGVQSMLTKSGVKNEDKTLTWTITANSNFAELVPENASIKTAKVVDQIQFPQELAHVSIIETKKDGTTISHDVESLFKANQIEYPEESNGNQFVFTLPNTSSKYVIQLTTRLTTPATSISNSASIEGVYTKKTTAVKLEGVAVAGGGASVGEATGSVIIHKVDTATGAALQGATFGLIAEGSTVAKTAKTNENGVASFEKVPTGTYHLVELTAPGGYQFEAVREWNVTVDKNGGTVQVDLTKENAVKQGNTIELTIGNSKIDAQVMFTKVDDLGNALPGAEFSIKKQGSQDILKTATSDTKGIVTFGGLTSGTYEVEETKAPEGYLRNEEAFTITVAADTGKVTYNIKDQTGISEVNGMPQVVNPRIKGDLILVKTNEDGSEKLEGAVFNLIDETTGALKQATSDVNGQVKFEDVAYGNYRIEEEAAPTGYQKSDKTISVKKERFQEQTTQVIELGNFINEREPAPIPPDPVDPTPPDPVDPTPPDPVDPTPPDPVDPTPPDPVDPTPPDPVDPTPPTPPTPDRLNTHPPEEVAPPVEIPDPDVPLGPGPDTPTTEIPEEEVPLGPAPEDPIVEIEDPEVPLAPAPHTPVNPATPTRPVGPEQPVFIIEDEMVPLAGLPDFAAPQTGDDSNLWLYSTLAVLSMAGIFVLILKKAKSKN